MRILLLFFFSCACISFLFAGTPFDDGKTIIPGNSSSLEPPNRLSNGGKTSGKTFNYVINPGDSLWKIAAQFLGNGARYWELVDLNKARYPSILKNPSLIYPGWTLKIPGNKNTPSPSSPSKPASQKPSNPPQGTSAPPSSTADNPSLNAYKGGRLPPSEFVRLFGPSARESMRRTGVPASIILAIAANETGWGKSSIGDAKNLFGIKGTGPAGSIRVPTTEYYNGRYVTVQDSFRKYNSWAESIDDFVKLISQASRYRNAMNYKNDPDQFAREIHKAGYATDPQYANKLISIMRTYDLYQYNK
ncbi:glucosaminidase domain-containing protein [bacterium]|nr:glucosaminidase domain-containing protein [bacterium]